MSLDLHKIATQAICKRVSPACDKNCHLGSACALQPNLGKINDTQVILCCAVLVFCSNANVKTITLHLCLTDGFSKGLVLLYAIHTYYMTCNTYIYTYKCEFETPRCSVEGAVSRVDNKSPFLCMCVCPVIK